MLIVSFNFKLKFRQNSSIFLSDISVKKSFSDHYSQSVGRNKQTNLPKKNVSKKEETKKEEKLKQK